MKKLKKFLLLGILGYAVGVAVSMFMYKDIEFTEALTHFISLGCLALGAIFGFVLMLDSKGEESKSNSFKGTDIHGNKVNQHFNANLLTEDDLAVDKTYMPNLYQDLPKLKKTGTFISSLYSNRKLRINMYPEMHELIIGTTGSGKSTFVIEPAIRCYSHTAEKPCMVITDPKGELYNNHAIHLQKEGYRLITLDLRNPYASSRWNPMDNAYLKYQRAHNLKSEVKVFSGIDPSQTSYKKVSSTYGEKWYGFNGIAYSDRKQLEIDMQSFAQSLKTDAENELREVAMTLAPIESKQDTSWEQGAQDFVYGIMLAMLEDTLNPELGLTREKFNFYNLYQICTYRDNNNNNMLGTIKDYASGRGELSKVNALISTVANNAPNTLRSFLGVMQPKLAILQDLGICYATSQSDISFDDFINEPTVLFIKVPDEKQSRHCIATMCISQLYKKLIEIASTSPGLKLSRPVYYLLDEFANLPKIPGISNMITVARSRRIFFQLVIQSYSQLDDKYSKEIANTIKSNCNIQIFIGTEDQQTRDDFSKLCGDTQLQVENESVNQDSETKKASTTKSKQTITKPLIESFELGQLPYDTSIIKIYGRPAIKTKMTQWFKCPIFDKTKMEEQYIPAAYFNELEERYDFIGRNKKILNDFDFDDMDI